jgi:DNA invertase Pin-like site-specific DNA recombinase
MSNKAKKSKPKRVAAYARRSSKRPQLSLARQMAVIRKYAKRHGLKIIKNYSDGAKGGGKA